MILSRHTVPRFAAMLLGLGALPLLGWAGGKPVIDPNTPEGRLLTRAQAENDLSRKLVMLELFPELFPASPSVAYVFGEMQLRYHQAGKLDKALASGANALVIDPNNLAAACLNWRIAADMKDPALTAVWIKQTGYIAEKVLKTSDPDMSQATRDCGSSARQAVEQDAYKDAVTAKNPAERVKLLEAFLVNHPQTTHADDIQIAIFMAYREQGGRRQGSSRG